MKTLITLTAILSISLAASADETPIAATQYADGSTNLWTQSDLTAALGLINRKYWRDMESDSGRRAWHGKRLGQYVRTDATGRIVMVNVYEDGFVHTNAGHAASARLVDPEAAAKAAAAKRAAAEAALAKWEAANLPAELAALRAAQRAAAKTNEVTVIYGN